MNTWTPSIVSELQDRTSCSPYKLLVVSVIEFTTFLGIVKPNKSTQSLRNRYAPPASFVNISHEILFRHIVSCFLMRLRLKLSQNIYKKTHQINSRGRKVLSCTNNCRSSLINKPSDGPIWTRPGPAHHPFKKSPLFPPCNYFQASY